MATKRDECSKCGGITLGGATKCLYCGAALPLPTKTVSAKAIKPVLCGLVPILVLAAVLSASVLAARSRQPTPEELSEALRVALGNHDLAAMKAALDQGADPNTPCGEPGGTILMDAASEGPGFRGETVRLLLEYGADPNRQTMKGDTALMYAVYQDNQAGIKSLIAKGADVNLKNHDGLTAFSIAIRNRRFGCAGILLKNGADVNVTDLDGQTPLMMAQEQGNQALVRLLKKAGAKR